MTTDETPEAELPQVVNLSNVSVERVEAELVRGSQTAIQQLQAEEAELNLALVATAQAKNLRARESLVFELSATEAHLEDCLIGVAQAENLTLSGQGGVILANSLTGQDIQAVALAGNNVRAANIRTGVLFGRDIQGNVITLVSGRTALLAGLAGGAVAGLILLAGKLLFGRKK